MVRTTIRDVARQAGVSITTVSKALNDYSDVNPETRQKIKEIAEKLNYVPNAAGRSMGGKADKVIGLPAAANIGNIFLMRQFFMNFPHDVAEAAEIDGLNRYGVFFRIAMPLARPTIATTAIFGFMGFWNAFTAPMLYIKTASKYTLTLGLQSFQSQNAGTMWNQVMAAACISVLPIIILYLIFNKFFMVGLRMDGEK